MDTKLNGFAVTQIQKIICFATSELTNHCLLFIWEQISIRMLFQKHYLVNQTTRMCTKYVYLGPWRISG